MFHCVCGLPRCNSAGEWEIGRAGWAWEPGAVVHRREECRAAPRDCFGGWVGQL